MKQITLEIHEIDTIPEALAGIQVITGAPDVSAVLIHVYFSVDFDEEIALRIRELILKALPKAIVVGVYTSGEIHNGKLILPSALLQVSVFERTQICAYAYKVGAGDEAAQGEAIRKQIDETENIRAAELITNNWRFTMRALFQEIDRCNPDVQIFGACPYQRQDKKILSFSNTSDEDTSVILITYAGDDFHIITDHAIGWKPLGAQMIATKSEGQVLYEIDGRPAFDIYKKYLQIPADENFFENVCEFPLLMHINDTFVLRIPFNGEQDNALNMVAPVPEGTMIYMSYGDPATIVEEVSKCRARIAAFGPQFISLYSCAVRRIYWKENVSNESMLFDEIAPSNGFFTGGEILRVNGKLLNFNSTILAIGMREGDAPEDVKELAEAVEKADEEAFARMPMVSRLVNFINVAMEELQTANEQMYVSSITDELTRLYNRREMERRIEICKEEKQQISLIMLDIDNFKRVNDTYGHDVGDMVLRRVASIISGCVRTVEGDVVARWGGEEFMVLLPETSRENAAKSAERIRRAVEAHDFPTVGNLTISIGVAEKETVEDPDTLYREVDRALYEAKAAGKNCVVIASHDAPPPATN